MKNDKKMDSIVNKICDYAEDYKEFVSIVGNQCAATDRKIEKIIELSKELEGLYNEHTL